MPIYTVVKGDTLSAIAKKQAISLDVLLDANPQIKDANSIRVGMKITVPDKHTDIPSKPDPIIPANVPTSVAQFLARARSAKGKKTVYKLGAGGMKPGNATPTDAGNTCDCSGFVCWALGVSRKTTHPLYVKFNGGWMNTDGMVNDANNSTGFFDALPDAKVGCIIVYPGGKNKIGHVGIVTEVTAGVATKVLHCSSGNYRSTEDAIQETNPDVFLHNPKTMYAWWVGV